MRRKAYLRNDELADSLDEAIKAGQPTERACRNFRLIAQHMLGDSRFARYGKETQEDMQSYALFKCIKAISSYKPKFRKSAFSYFTRTVETAYYEFLRKHYRYINLKRIYAERKLDTLSRLNPTAAQRMRDEMNGGNE